jgi:FSR family fosmidomycin resistance protein-like MFS transporter
MVIAGAHMVNDMYASFVPPLLPRIMGELGLSITLAATLAVTYSIASALPQPLFGYLSDRYGRRVFAVAGPVVGGVFVSIIGWAPGFAALVALLLIGGIGSAAFHPPGASYAVRVRAGRGGGARYSLFAFAGSIGFALGPLVAVGLVQGRGLQGMWVAMLPVILLAPFVFLALPSGRSEIRAAAGPPPPRVGEVLGHLRGPLGLIFGVSTIMAFVQRVFLTMEPIIVAEAGGTEARGAVVLSVYLASQALGTVVGGVLADKVDRRLLLAHLCFWAVPTHLLAVWIGPQGSLGLLAAAAAGFLAADRGDGSGAGSVGDGRELGHRHGAGVGDRLRRRPRDRCPRRRHRADTCHAVVCARRTGSHGACAAPGATEPPSSGGLRDRALPPRPPT